MSQSLKDLRRPSSSVCPRIFFFNIYFPRANVRPPEFRHSPPLKLPSAPHNEPSLQLPSLDNETLMSQKMRKKTFTLARRPDHSTVMGQSKLASLSSFDAKKPRFTLFPKLPIELRLKIWKESYEPRIIELRFAQKWNMCRYDFIIPKFPPVLHVNKEARLESLKYYKFSFKHRHCRRPVLFNFSIDTLHIRDYTPGDQSLLGRQNTMRILPDKEKVQKLSVTSGAFRISSSGGGIPSAPVILLFPALKEVTVCSPITESLYFQQDGELYLQSHLGKCVRASDASSCFPKNSKLALTPESGSQPISNIIESFFRFEKALWTTFCITCAMVNGEVPSGKSQASATEVSA